MPEQKAEIVHKQEHISVRALEKMYQADWSMICRWVKNYIAEGEASFVHKWHPGNPFAALHTLLVVPPPRPPDCQGCSVIVFIIPVFLHLGTICFFCHSPTLVVLLWPHSTVIHRTYYLTDVVILKFVLLPIFLCCLPL